MSKEAWFKSLAGESKNKVDLEVVWLDLPRFFESKMEKGTLYLLLTRDVHLSATGTSALGSNE